MKRGERKSVLRGDPFSPAWVSLRLPTLGCDWSEPVPLPQVNYKKKDQQTAGSFRVLCKQSRAPDAPRIHVSVDWRFQAGSLHLAFFTPYWVFDMTDLGLSLSENKGRTSVPRPVERAGQPAPPGQGPEGADEDKEGRDQKLHGAISDSRHALMFSFEKPKEGKNKLFVHGTGRNNSEWSEGVSLDAAGMSGQITMLGKTARSADDPRLSKYEVGVDIQTGESAYHRTKFIILAPRYVVTNALSMPIHVRSFADRPKVEGGPGRDYPSFVVAPDAKRVFYPPYVPGIKADDDISLYNTLALSVRRVAGDPTDADQVCVSS